MFKPNKIYATSDLRHAYEVIRRGQNNVYPNRLVPYIWVREVNQPMAPIRVTIENDGDGEFVKLPRGIVYADQTAKKQPW